MKILFTVWGVRIPFFGFMIALGVMAAMWVLSFDAKRKGIDSEKATDMGAWAVIGGILGARLGYILFYSLDFYLQNPVEILKMHEGGMSIHGGIAGGMAASLLFLKGNKDLKLMEMADLAAPPLILAQAIGRIGCDVYGSVMSNPKLWGIAVEGRSLHPAQLYEFTLDYLLFFYLWRKRRNKRYEGQLFGIYLIGFALIRSIVELFRGNPRVLGIISVSHLLSLSLILAGLLWIRVASKRERGKVQNKLKCFSLRYEALALTVVLIASVGVFYGVQVNF
ncbi:hypothetical protein PM10SUCC1_35800 [Propionigenium maris DSM 9537]|uniref:Phosphatidylglycerol--prolipoprotein diacylglyceryl transferase n=1 Tax=Propionigenium maris DSM 9537 TaxID=1123000 RepID=A0A9W6LP61_9FUSO|nr:prolipoprotein diacylglyceryl transferase [Propionigenium maris]GLI58066.1 hypothetical protein PM10SUCC1_35800 [Propionigenium maris DSM 9537]